jgi:RNA polymerase sigma-70 factor, ECF subfamily
MDHLLDSLRQGDERAFEALIDQYQAALLRTARVYVQDDTSAEEVVQETWIAVLKGLERFEERSSLKTWIYSILINRAKTQAERDGRRQHLALAEDDEIDEAAVSPERFHPQGHDLAGHWRERPDNWETLPEQQMLSGETMRVIRQAIDQLAPLQRQVILLRDVEGWTSEDVCNVLTITETNQRVLLHRARSRVRQALERYFEETK